MMKFSLILVLLTAGLVPFAAAASTPPTIIMGDHVQRVADPGSLAGTHVLVLYGRPTKASLFRARPKSRGGTKFAAHVRNDTGRVTVIFGTVLVGAGDAIEADKVLLGAASTTSFAGEQCQWKPFGLSPVWQQELAASTPALQEAYRDVIAPTGVPVSSVKGCGHHIRDSAHYAGRAIDVAPEWVGDNAQTWDYIARMVSSGKFQKIGLRPALYARAFGDGFVRWAADHGTEIFRDNVGAGEMLHLQVP